MKLLDFVEELNSYIQKKVIEKKFVDPNLEFFSDDYNIIFSNKKVQFRFETMKFLEKTDHEIFINLLGSNRLILNFDFTEQFFEEKITDSYFKMVDEKVEKAIKILELLYQNNVFCSPDCNYLNF